MKVELFPFQKKALQDIRMKAAEAMGSYHRTHSPQVVSFTAPTGAGKTIIMAAFIESVLFGDENFAEQQNAIFVWLSDSPQLNEQSKLKLDTKADKIRLAQCVTVEEESFDRETFEDGHIYFLNTQKLAVSSNLTKHGDGRTYTIWETIANTVRKKNDRLYFIIDEAHRGMQGREASKATTIMQKFIKGSDRDRIDPMPVVIGMSATTQRFNKLVENTSSTIHKVVVTTGEVRASGLLKDRIIITYPEEDSVNNDMAILQAAADDWKEKWGHWKQYCYEQHHAYVNPIFIIQVQNGSGKKVSDTDLDDCLAKVEERTGFLFEPGQVVHTFGQTDASITVNGLEVKYVEPSHIAEDKNIRVVFFKSDYNHADESPTDQQHTNEQDAAPEEDLFDREAVMKFINDAGLLSYNVRAFRITNYLNSLFKLSHLLTMSKLHREAITEVQSDIAEMIHEHVVSLKADGKYDDLVLQVQQFKLATQIFDAFGESVDNYSVHDMFTTTDTDLERQFRAADAKLGNEGIGLVYGNKYGDLGDPTGYEIDVILFVADEECMNRLQDYAQDRFHSMNDKYRKYIATVESESIRRRYDTIVSDGDSVSKHNFRLPETIQVPHAVDGKPYRDHLFVNPETGVASIKLNIWEAGVIEEEEKRSDFVCWIRNPSRGSWALCLPYEEEGDIKPTYPDFIIVRRDDILGYVIDILEPHNPEYKDNLGKAKGFAEYARQNPGLGRIQIIRLSKDASGNNKFKRLDMAKSATRKKVLESMTIEELDHIFDGSKK